MKIAQTNKPQGKLYAEALYEWKRPSVCPDARLGSPASSLRRAVDPGRLILSRLSKLNPNRA